MFSWLTKRDTVRNERLVLRRPSAKENSSRKKEVYGRTRSLPRREEGNPRDGWGRNGLPSFSDVERLIGIYAATGEGQGAFYAAQDAVTRQHGTEAPYVAQSYYPPPSDSWTELVAEPRPPHQRPPRPETSAHGASASDNHPGVPLAVHIDEPSVRPPVPTTETIFIKKKRRTRLHHQTEYSAEEVENASDDEEDGLNYADLPPVENDNRLRSRTEGSRTHELRNRHTATRETTIREPTVHESRRRESRRQESGRHGSRRHEPRRQESSRHESRRHMPRQRESGRRESRRHESDDGDGSTQDEDDSSHAQERAAVPEPRLRGGAAPTERRRTSSRRRETYPGREPPTRTSAIGAGTVGTRLDEISPEPRRINLVFFCIIRGKIVLSRKPEVYTTFLELQDHPMGNEEQQYDSWFVETLQDQYCIITRKARGFFINSLLMRTIGLAIFLRFERTVRRTQDPLGYVLTAKAPAVNSKTEPTSQFQYQMRYPSNFKNMLVILDRLAALSDEKRPSFYMVEIKEAPDTGKVYLLLILLILITTGGGTAFAVIQGDISTGISIASYSLTCFSLFLALVAAGQWLGLTRPSAFSFAYDVERNLFWGMTNVEDLDRSEPNYSRFRDSYR